MQSKISLAFTTDTLALSGELDFDSVSEVAEQGKKWLQESAPKKCHLDLSGVDYSNSAGIALLLSWIRVAEEHKKTLAILHTPNSITALAKLGGLDNIMQIN